MFDEGLNDDDEDSDEILEFERKIKYVMKFSSLILGAYHHYASTRSLWMSRDINKFGVVMYHEIFLNFNNLLKQLQQLHLSMFLDCAVWLIL